MSDLAIRMRNARRRWAVPGSSHDRVVRYARVVLPVAIAVLVILLAAVPLTNGRDVSFVLDKTRANACASPRRSIAAVTARASRSRCAPDRRCS
jgi:lipopolysaccharide export system protein LptC